MARKQRSDWRCGLKLGAEGTDTDLIRRWRGFSVDGLVPIEATHYDS